jgi:hypothetical protein
MLRASASEQGARMNGPGHYQKAEELAEHAEGIIEGGDTDGLAPVWAALAQVHATLALADATRARVAPMRKRDDPHLLAGFDQEPAEPR